MYPKTYTCLKYSGIVREVVESFKSILGIDVKLSDHWSQNLLCVTQKSQMLKGDWLGWKECMVFSHRYYQTITLFLYLIVIPILFCRGEVYSLSKYIRINQLDSCTYK